MKTLAASLLAMALVGVALAQTNAPTPAEWQSIMLGTTLKVECSIKPKKSSEQDYRDIEQPLKVFIAVNNRTSSSVNYSGDVFFLVSGNNNGIKAKDQQSSQFSVTSGSYTNLEFRASNHREDVKIKLVTNWVGYIVRLSAYGTPLKTVASSPALERLAKDANRMAALEAGNTVPLK